ncbi:transposase [Azospirillum argentinense]|uniref:transposase n=2 Tax=Azospirillum argentinense TaxID=2970906 RepID=UPI00268C1A38
MEENSKVVRLRQPEEIDDPLTTILRDGARRLLEQAIEAEVDAFLASMRDVKLPDGRERVVRRLSGQEGFQVLPRRWVVERSFGWMVRWRRLVRDYEARIDVSEGMIYVAMGSIMLRRLTT